jgi:signal transduction histidine kinase
MAQAQVPARRREIKIKRQTTVAVAFGLAFIALFAVGVVSYRDSRSEAETQKWVVHTYTVIETIDELNGNLAEAESSRRGFVLTEDWKFLRSYMDARDGIRKAFLELQSLTADNPSQQKRWDEFEPVLEQRITLFQLLIDREMQAPADSALQVETAEQGRLLTDQLRGILSDAKRDEGLLLAQRTGAVEASAKLAGWFAVLGYAFGMLLIVIALFITRREMAERERTQLELQAAKAGLEIRVQSRTEELRIANEILRAEVEERGRAERKIHELNVDLERRVNERTQELTRTNKELESFSYSVAHDLRAPLRHIDGFARPLMETYALEIPERQHYLDRILAAVKHMGHLVDNLLNLARIGRTQIVRERVNLGDLAQRAIADFSAETERRGVEWQVEALPEVDGDPGLLGLVFSNLLSNAAKFTRNSKHPEIQVGAQSRNGQTSIFVRDNGVGFDTRYADKLFGVFQRLHREEDFEGTGVGLATVQRIIHRHGGEVWAESELGKGATFYFTLGPQVPGSFSIATEEERLEGI